MLLYTSVDMCYHIASLVGRLILRQLAWQWPPPSRHPRTARGCPRRWWILEILLTPILPARVRRPRRAARRLIVAALLGAFGVSAVIHDLGMWGLGRGTEFRTVGGFFVLMGVGVILEHAFEVMTARRLGGFWGWAWTMMWTIGWCTLMIDALARRGMAATDPPPNWLRPGKLLIETISPLWRYHDIYVIIIFGDNHISP